MLSRLWNIWFYQWAWPAKLVSIAVLAALLIGIIAGVRSCGKKQPKLDQAEIQKAQKAIAEQDRKEMIDVLAQSDAKEAAADETEANANAAKVNAIAESKKQWSESSNEELAQELERRARE